MKWYIVHCTTSCIFHYLFIHSVTQCYKKLIMFWYWFVIYLESGDVVGVRRLILNCFPMHLIHERVTGSCFGGCYSNFVFRKKHHQIIEILRNLIGRVPVPVSEQTKFHHSKRTNKSFSNKYLIHFFNYYQLNFI